MARHFNRTQRTALFLYARGRCANPACMQPLEQGWHADHRHPWSGGGPTDLLNGQALCAVCNLRKAAKTPGEIMGSKPVKTVIVSRKSVGAWPKNRPLRDWQRRAFETWCSAGRQDFLLVCTPGGGKTTGSLRIAHHALSERLVTRVVVVCPTENLRRQWADAAHQIGLSLDPRWSNSSGREVAGDYHGIVVTYQQVSYASAVFDKQCEEPTFVVFDEIHHAADQLCWGDALRQAFSRAELRCALSGTPFRGDRFPIPFVEYEEGRSRPDFSYSYAEALRDGICRPTYFPTLNGRARWLSRDGSLLDCWLLDDVRRHHESERLRTILDPSGGWLRAALRAANDKLTEIRASGHPDAAALVLSIDQTHAKAIAGVVRKFTGQDPVLAISEDPEASAKLKDFAGGTERFLICVRMASEGVDLPRLRVGVLATNVQSELFFRQAVGRLVRVVPGVPQQSATMYLPAVEPILGYARQIKEERDHELAQARVGLPADFSERGGQNPPAKLGAFVPLGSSPAEHDTIFDGASFSPAELSYAERFRAEFKIPLATPQVAAMLRYHASDNGLFVIHRESADPQETVLPTARQQGPACNPAPPRPVSPQLTPQAAPVDPASDLADLPIYARKDELRKRTQRAAAKLGGLLGLRPWVIHKQWIESGGSPSEEASTEDLERKLRFFLERIAEINSGRV